MTTRPRSAFAEQRAQFADGLNAAARQIDAWLARAQMPGTPENAELSVRKGMRAVDTLARRVIALRNALAPEPWITAPTRERAAKSETIAEPVMQGNNAVGVRHRVLWPVEQLQRRALLEVPQAVAGARFRRAYQDSRFTPGITNYSGLFTASDPTGKLPIPRGEIQRQKHWRGEGHAPLASEEFSFCWARLEPDLRAVAWVLILEEPLPGEAHALSAIEYGRKITRQRSDDYNRGWALSALKFVLVRLDTIYGHWDRQRRELRAPAG